MSVVEKQAIELGALPAEVLLHILSYLDLPELLSLSRTSWNLRPLAADPILHRNRILVVAPSRVEHSLFAQGVAGPMRPTVPDLVQRNVLRGLHIERRWRMGAYLYSAQSVRQYETPVRLYYDHIARMLTRHLRARALQPMPNSLSSNPHDHVPIETRSHRVSRSLLPVIVRLKWSMARDRVSRSVHVRPPVKGLVNDEKTFKRWLEGSGRALMRDHERVRLAICPGIKKLIGFYENLS